MEINIKEIIKKNNNFIAKLDKNPLYPDGKGGQLGDRGKIYEANILFVSDKELIIDKEIKPGNYEVELDFENREDISKQHTAQHLLSAIMKDKYDINTVGFRMSEDYSTIDIDKRISKKLLGNIENYSNFLLNKKYKVFEKIYSKEEAYNLNLRKDVSNKIQGDVRVIYIENVDASACGGFHVNNLIDINIIKIIKTENIKNNFLRIYYIAGKRVLDFIQKLENINDDIGELLQTNTESYSDKIQKLIEENKNYKKSLESFYNSKADLLMDNLKPYKKIDNTEIFYFEKDDESYDYLLKKLELNNYIFILKDNDTFKIQSDNVNVGELIKNINKTFHTKGGGGKNNGQIKGKIKLENIITNI